MISTLLHITLLGNRTPARCEGSQFVVQTHLLGINGLEFFLDIGHLQVRYLSYLIAPDE